MEVMRMMRMGIAMSTMRMSMSIAMTMMMSIAMNTMMSMGGMGTIIAIIMSIMMSMERQMSMA